MISPGRLDFTPDQGWPRAHPGADPPGGPWPVPAAIDAGTDLAVGGLAHYRAPDTDRGAWLGCPAVIFRGLLGVCKTRLQTARARRSRRPPVIRHDRCCHVLLSNHRWCLHENHHRACDLGGSAARGASPWPGAAVSCRVGTAGRGDGSCHVTEAGSPRVRVPPPAPGRRRMSRHPANVGNSGSVRGVLTVWAGGLLPSW